VALAPIDAHHTMQDVRTVTPLRNPDPDLPGFQLPRFDAPRAIWEDAFVRLNSIELQLDQIERGYVRAYSTKSARSRGEPDIVALREFCEAEGLLPADVAAEAILVRWSTVMDAAFNGIDVHEGDPPYVMQALRELQVEYDVPQSIGTGRFRP